MGARVGTTLIGNGTAGNNIAQNTALGSIVNAPPGRYRLTGTARHSLADGLKITGIPVGTIIIPGGPGDTVTLPTLVFDLTVATTINIVLNVATGASDTAAAVMCLELINKG